MVTPQETADTASISVATAGHKIENLLAREWLLTNGRGGYASGTIAGCNTRGYHGLLVGSLQPPVNRIMALAGCLETVRCKGKTFELSTFEFADKFAPEGFRLLKRFRRDIGAHFDYEFDAVKLTKSIYLLRDTDMVAVVYDFTHVGEPLELAVRPFVGLRDFHSLQVSHAALRSRWLGSAFRGVLVHHAPSDSCGLVLCCPSAHFEKDPQWWFKFIYRAERERGLNSTEDLWTPGLFKCRVESPAKIVLWASLHPDGSSCVHDKPAHPDIDKVREDLRQYQQKLLDSRFLMSVEHRTSSMLCLAADQFVTKRQVNHKCETTIVAGYHWFADWGRDAFIALPGLLLATGRFDEARSVLSTFAAAAEDGMIPNRFDDNGNAAHFNSVDASLWFINAAFQYLEATGDSATFREKLLPTIRWVIESYAKGTRFGIHADADGLIAAGDQNTQLTWMDAKCDGIAFTPRYGKAVEINALWYNALMLAKQSQISGLESQIQAPDAAKVQSSFCQVFWNRSKSYLNDCILPDGSADDSLRPNQVFAVSLKFSPLPAKQQAAVVAAVQSKLLTPYGLRTLSPDAPAYKGRYTGPPRQRDEAYHQGTVWPYLIGPFVEAYLKVNTFSTQSSKQAAEFIEPLLRHLTESGCVGSISEIFDGDPPHYPKGCIAQAWSVAELIRACRLISS